MSSFPMSVFVFLALATGVLALATVLTKHILRAAIYLMGVLCTTSGLYLLLGAEFLAGVQILVYVGGIVVLLVFAVMLTRSEELDEDHPSVLRKIMGALAALSFYSGSAWMLSQSSLTDPRELDPTVPDIKALGHVLLSSGGSGYALPFEVISLLLLAVLIAGIVLARKEAR